MDQAHPLLSIRGLCKHFAVPVLQDLDLQCRAGEVHALVGCNGAGKSTLCNIIGGVMAPNAGEMVFAGKPHAPASVREAEAVGIYMVMQELNLFPTLSISENLFFKRLNVRRHNVRASDNTKRGLIIDHAALRDHSHELLNRVGLNDINPDMPVSELGVGQQQLLEITRVLDRPLRMLILDEPTAALTDPQIDLLFEQIDILRNRDCAILYISHRMDEIQRIADRVSVLRDGVCVATQPVADTNMDTLIRSMTSGDLSENLEVQTVAEREPYTVMRVEGLSREAAFRDVSFEVKSGEILGIGGLIGSGRTEVMRCLFGADKADHGWLSFVGDNFYEKQVHHEPRDAIANGLGLVVEDRKSQGLMLAASISDNIFLGQESSISNSWGVLSHKSAALRAMHFVESLNIKCESQQQSVGQLSGGNQQKVLIARWLSMDLPILLFDEPTRGVDAQTKRAIHRLLNNLVAAGKAVIVVTSETQELLDLSDRIIVMSNGRLSAEMSAEAANQEKILQASFRYYTRGSEGRERADDGR